MRRASLLPALLALAVVLRAGAAEADSAASATSATAAFKADEAALVRSAFERNPDLRAARWSEGIASADVESASALSNPVARGEWLHVQSPSEYGWGVGLEWAPPQPGVYGSRTAAAQARVLAAKQDFNERAADLEAEVRLSYARIQALEREIELAGRSVDTRRQVQAAVQERLKRGAANRIDVSLAAVSMARGEQERDLLVLSRNTQLAELRALAGLPATQELELRLEPSAAGTAASTASSTQLADSTLEQRAIAARPLLRADAARTEAADQALSAERAKRYPWLELQARYRRHDQSTYPNDVTVGVAVTLPIFSQNAGPIAAAEATRREQRDLAAAHRAGIERDVRVLRRESEERRLIAEHYAQTIAPVLNEHVALVKQALVGLELDVTSLLAAEDLVTRGGIEYLEARLAQRSAEIALARALGAYGHLPTASQR